jgi:predicted permease
MAGDVFRMSVELEARPVRPGETPGAIYRVAMPGYFHTAGLRLLRGREFTAADTEGTPRVAVINETMARQNWPGEDAVGKRVRVGSSSGPWREVIGVLQDAKQRSWTAPPDSEIYLPFLQDSSYQHGTAAFMTMTVVLRTSVPPAIAAPAIREQVRALDRNVPVTSMLDMEQVVDDAIWLPRLEMSVLSGMAFLALLLATVGIYAVVSYVVAGRTQEIGIRMALGADARSVARLVLAQSLIPVTVGAAAGLAGTFALARWMRTLLFEIDAADPLTLVGVTLLLVGVAAAAAIAPARRASRLDPLTALRY